MDITDEYAVDEFIAAWGAATRPTEYGDPAHCDECAEANRILMALDRDELDRTELIESSNGWFYAWMGFEGWLYFLPGIVKTAMMDPSKDLRILLDQLCPEYLSSLTLVRAKALHKFLHHCRACAYASDDSERASLQLAIDLTKTDLPPAGCAADPARLT